MIARSVQEAFDAQINKELYSAYLYLAMNAWFQKQSLLGFANWMKVQAQEEQLHAQLMYTYVFERGGVVTLRGIEAPPASWKSVTDVFQAVLEHEQFVTASIHALADTAEAEKDRASIGFLDWFVKEQVEEEKNVSQFLARLKLFGEVPQALYVLDVEMKARVFALPTDLPITLP